MSNKLYASERWLKRRYLIDRKTPEQIAEECGVSHMTVYRYLRKFGLMR